MEGEVLNRDLVEGGGRNRVGKERRWVSGGAEECDIELLTCSIVMGCSKWV